MLSEENGPSPSEAAQADDLKLSSLATQEKQQAAARAPRAQLQVNDSRAFTSYTNFCRVTGTPEEVIVDFGLNCQPTGVPTEPINIAQRIVMNFFTAKRLLAALQLSVERHEAAFGVLETDINKRVLPGAWRQSTESPRS